MSLSTTIENASSVVSLLAKVVGLGFIAFVIYMIMAPSRHDEQMAMVQAQALDSAQEMVQRQQQVLRDEALAADGWGTSEGGAPGDASGLDPYAGVAGLNQADMQRAMEDASARMDELE